jgi:signal transduction histidine kinase
VRTDTLLVLAMALVTVAVTLMFLLLLRYRLHAQLTASLAADLRQSITAFQNLESERMAALDREGALLAALPTLKALLTSGDALTIQDGATEFWQLSGTDLFALADASRNVVAVYADHGATDPALRTALGTVLAEGSKHYLIHNGSLYACSLRPLYFGDDRSGALLGYVVSGISIERTVRLVSGPAGMEAAFVSRGGVLASTLAVDQKAALTDPALAAATPAAPALLKLDGARYLATSKDLSGQATAPLRLVLLKSMEPNERWIERMDRVVLRTGLLAVLAGTVLMIILARELTRPLHELVQGVRAFGLGDSRHHLPTRGTREIRALSDTFAGMRQEIEDKRQALLDAERLATIGSMASSISHDLRHYLAAVYANAEFLATGSLSDEDRNEIFSEIRSAVHGTTDMLESLLVFSRTGVRQQRTPELLTSLVERAVALVRAHPDAQGVSVLTRLGAGRDAAVLADGKQLERALFNLILNGAEAARSYNEHPLVTVTLTMAEDLLVSIVDNGPGVPDSIRHKLFDPFVSEGKQKGTGLGLTLAQRIAAEHEGSVSLRSSRPGETIFDLRLSRSLSVAGLRAPVAPLEKASSHDTSRS